MNENGGTVERDQYQTTPSGVMGGTQPGPGTLEEVMANPSTPDAVIE